MVLPGCVAQEHWYLLFGQIRQSQDCMGSVEHQGFKRSILVARAVVRIHQRTLQAVMHPGDAHSAGARQERSALYRVQCRL